MRHERVTRAYFTWNILPHRVAAIRKKSKKKDFEDLCVVHVNVCLPTANLITGKL